MSKRTRQKFHLAIKVTFLCLSLSLLPISKGWAQQCTDANIKADIEKLNNTDEWNSTIEALRKCGSPAVWALITALKDNDDRVRINAASALGSMDASAAPAVPALIAALNDKNERVRSSATYALESIGAEAKVVVPALTARLKDTDELVRDNAASALGSIGASAASAVPALTEALNDKDEQVRDSAARALSRIAPGSQVAEKESPVFDRASEWIFYHKWILGVAICVVSLSSLWFLIIGSAKQGNNVERQALLDNRTVQRDAQAIAWECLKQTYRPSSAKRDRVLAVIASLDGNDNAEAHLQYLEKHLGLIQTIGPAQDTIRFAVDLLAEYLAALYVVELYSNNEAKWREFLAQADAMQDKEAIIGFLLAVRDCCLALGTETKIPSFVPEELANLSFSGRRR